MKKQVVDGNVWTSLPGYHGGPGGDVEKERCSLVFLKDRIAEILGTDWLEERSLIRYGDDRIVNEEIFWKKRKNRRKFSGIKVEHGIYYDRVYWRLNHFLTPALYLTHRHN